MTRCHSQERSPCSSPSAAPEPIGAAGTPVHRQGPGIGLPGLCLGDGGGQGRPTQTTDRREEQKRGTPEDPDKAIELAGNTAEVAYLTRRRDQLG
jgi:hypothetical protein